MLRRSVIIFLISLLSFSAFAGDVTPERARRVASNFMLSKGSDAQYVLVDQPLTKSDATPSYYIFKNVSGGKGFVIVSGSDASSPILGYSLDSDFNVNDIPSNVRWWLGLLAKDVEYGRSHASSLSRQIAAEWSTVESGIITKGETDEHVLNTALWNQGAPFNNMCPDMVGGRAITGCVATAISIVMRFHAWPDKGNGILPDYTYLTDDGYDRTQPGHELTATYDWQNMPLTNGAGWNTEQQRQVAQLMFDVGVMCQMMYNPTSSGAVTETGISGLGQYMNYDYNYETIESGTSDVFSKVQEEIRNERPMVVSGRHGDSGHAFVLDGYDDQGKCHINFGWGGIDNGFFAYPNFGDYSQYVTIFTKIIPLYGGVSVNDKLFVDYLGNLQKGSDADDFTVTTILRNESLHARYSGQVALVKVNKRDEIVKFLCDPVAVNLDRGRSMRTTLTCKDDTDVVLGDGYFVACKTEGLDEWHLVKYDTQSLESNFIPLSTVRDLEEVTTISYDNTTKILSIDTDPDARFYISNAGSPQKSASSEIDCTRLFGDCTVAVIVGSVRLSFTFKVR